MLVTFSDPESFVRGDPTLTKSYAFLVNEDRNSTKSRPLSAVSKTQFSGGPMMAQMNVGLVAL